MRILFIPLGHSTHYLSMVPLAWACRAAGHDVRVASQPPAIASITGSGMTAVSAGGSYDFHKGHLESTAETERLLREYSEGEQPGIHTLQKLPPEALKRFQELKLAPSVKTAEAMIDDLVPFVRGWCPDLVVADPLVLAGPLVASCAGAPLVHHLFGPAVSRKVSFPGNGTVEGVWTDELRRLFERFEVEVAAEYAVGTVDPCPAGLQVPDVPARIPVRYVPYNGSGVAPEWLSRPAERPRVCVTWGSVMAHNTGGKESLLPGILAGLSSLDIEVVVAVHGADRELLGEVPPEVRVAEGLPLNLLLPTCAAVVHHAGSGTMLTSAFNGVPQLIVAARPDTTFNAISLAATGAGVHLPAERTDADGVKSAVTALLSEDAHREAARRLREEILAQPTPAEVVGTLEQLV